MREEGKMRRLWLIGLLLLAGCGPAAPTVAPSGAIGVVVNAVRDPLTPGHTRPQPGFRFVAVDVTLTNAGARPRYYNVTRAILVTGDDRQYRRGSGIDAAPDPPLLTGTANPGERVRGWVAFEIPVAAPLAAFRYEDDTPPPVVAPLP
jgi:hypothetical protein